MTTQEAIEYFKKNNERIRSTAIDENRTSKFMKETIDANNMAIRSLEADRTVEKVLYAIREEMQYIKVAEMQIYGKGSWRFTSAVEDIITKHLQEVENG